MGPIDIIIQQFQQGDWFAGSLLAFALIFITFLVGLMVLITCAIIRIEWTMTPEQRIRLNERLRKDRAEYYRRRRCNCG